MSASISSPSVRSAAIALPDRGELRLEPIAFALARGDRPLQRLDLDAAPDGLLARSPAELVDLASVLIGVPEGRLRLFELALPFGELLDRPFEVRLDARELRVDRVEPSRAARLGRERLPRRALSFERAPERLLRLCPVRLRVSEPELDVGEPAGRGGPGIRAGQHLAVQRIEPGAGLLSPRRVPRPSRCSSARARPAVRAIERPRASGRAPPPARSTSRASSPSPPAVGAASAVGGAPSSRPAGEGGRGPGHRACAPPVPCAGDASRCPPLPRCTSDAPPAWRAAPPRAGPDRRPCAGPGRCRIR